MATVNLRIGPADNGCRMTVDDSARRKNNPDTFMNCLEEC